MTRPGRYTELVCGRVINARFGIAPSYSVVSRSEIPAGSLSRAPFVLVAALDQNGTPIADLSRGGILAAERVALDLVTGDGRSRDRWFALWNRDDSNDLYEEPDDSDDEEDSYRCENETFVASVNTVPFHEQLIGVAARRDCLGLVLVCTAGCTHDTTRRLCDRMHERFTKSIHLLAPEAWSEAERAAIVAEFQERVATRMTAWRLEASTAILD